MTVIKVKDWDHHQPHHHPPQQVTLIKNCNKNGMISWRILSSYLHVRNPTTSTAPLCDDGVEWNGMAWMVGSQWFSGGPIDICVVGTRGYPHVEHMDVVIKIQGKV